ncbi:unnamed protein product, partial [Callosobruchus maculatus]
MCHSWQHVLMRFGSRCRCCPRCFGLFDLIRAKGLKRAAVLSRRSLQDSPIEVLNCLQGGRFFRGLQWRTRDSFCHQRIAVFV